MPIGVGHLRKLGEIWRPKLWTPKPIRVQLIILAEADFRTAALKHGFSPNIGAFAVWKDPKPWYWQDKIYCKPDTVNLIPHELRHLDSAERHFHPS